jgi:hypothetical protein
MQDRAGASMRGARVWLALVLVAGVLAIYGQTLAFDFVSYDDDQHVTENPIVLRGLSGEGIAFAFSKSNYRGGGFPPQPLTWLSHMLDVEIFGLAAGGHHGTSLALHALGSLLLFAALRELTGATWRSAAAAALWAWHPLRVESVAWISERKDVLSGVFVMLTLWCYARYGKSGARAAWWGAIASLALGLMSKPTVIPLPVLLLLLDVWPLARRSPFERLLLEKVPFFLLSGIAALATYEFNRGWITTTEIVPPALRASNAMLAVVSYLRGFLWPSQLAALYPHPYLPMQGGVPPSGPAIVTAAVLLVAITFAVLRARRHPHLAVGWLFFLGMLLPTTGIVQVGAQASADRYTYLPAIGVSLGAVWTVSEVIARVRAPALRRALSALAVVGLAGYGVAAFVQTRIWRDSETLYRHTLTVSPRATLIYFNLAAWLRQHGRADEAVAVYERAAARNPQDARAQYLLGVAYQLEGRLPEAIEQYRAAARLDPSNPKIRRRLQAALARQLGP